VLGATQSPHIEGRELKQDRADFWAESRKTRLDDVLGSIAGMQKELIRRVATPANMAWVA